MLVIIISHQLMVIRAPNRRQQHQPQENKLNPKDHVLREVVNSLRDIAVEFHGADQLRERLRAALAPLLDQPPAAAEQKPFMFAIMGPDGTAHIEESCVSSTASQLAHEVNCLNDSSDTGYSIVPVFLSACAQADSGDAKNAARYLHLRNKMCFTSSSDELPTMALSSAIPAPHHDVHHDWFADRFDASADAAVDADMARTEEDDE